MIVYSYFHCTGAEILWAESAALIREDVHVWAALTLAQIYLFPFCRWSKSVQNKCHLTKPAELSTDGKGERHKIFGN